MSYDVIKAVIAFARQKPSGAAMLLICFMLGWGTWAHFGGLVKADELNTVKADVDALKDELANLKEDVKSGRLEGLEGQLFAAKVQQCTADTGELRQAHARRVDTLLGKYRDAGGKTSELRLPDCGEL